MSIKDQENWVDNKWRPAMGWMYLGVCVFDFMVFPVLWAWAQTVQGTPITQWSPLTLQGAGLFHMAMGAVLGIAVWNRSKEKIAGVAGQTLKE